MNISEYIFGKQLTDNAEAEAEKAVAPQQQFAPPEPTCVCKSLLWGHERSCPLNRETPR